MLIKKFLSFICLVFIAIQVCSANLYYRYTNPEGNTVIDYKVPADLVHNGYEVISSQGDIIETVEPFDPSEVLTPEEVAALEKQRKRDLTMLRSYSTVEDFNQARDRKLRALRNEVAVLESNLREYRDQLHKGRKEAANRQRSGAGISESFQKHLDKLTMQVNGTNRTYQERLKQLEKKQAFFSEQLQRFKELKGLTDQPEQTDSVQ